MSLCPPFELASGRFKAVAPFSSCPDQCEGGQGIIYKGLDNSSQPKRTVAIKVFKSSAVTAKNEATIMEQVRHHPNIIEFIHFEESLGFNGCIVMEAAQLCFFDLVIDQIPLRDATILAHYMRDIAAGLVHVHACGVAHLDLKLENILATGDLHCPTLKICDFGFATAEVAPSPAQSRNGTDGYRAPELYAQVVGVGPGYDAFAADAWSLGYAYAPAGSTKPLPVIPGHT